MGKPIAFLGAFHVCPATNGNVPHVGGATLGASPNVFVGGVPVARQGDKLVCVGPPDTITGGSTGVFVNGKPVARFGDGTAHGGKIVVGNPTVLVGDGFSKVSPTVEHGSWNPVMKAAPPKHEMACGNVTYHTDAAGEICEAGGRVAELNQEPTPHAYLEPGRVYGGMTLPCGGRDSTNCTVLKDPETAHLDDDPLRKPVVTEGTVLPVKGTRKPESPVRIIKYSERNQISERAIDGKTFRTKRDADGFPEFTLFETYLDDSHIGSGDDRAHFKACNERLAALLKEDSNLRYQLGLTDDQMLFFQKERMPGRKPPGLTWHHHQETGKMQLVDERLHDLFRHTGGMATWGGGR